MKIHFPTLSVALMAFGLTGCAHTFLDRRLASEDEPSQDFRWQRREALHARDLLLGMEMQDVRRAWGTPGEVQYAGETDGGNERWLYFTSPSTRWGLRQARVVYFEGGRVSGWETGPVN
jgi:hypothetical protein